MHDPYHRSPNSGCLRNGDRCAVGYPYHGASYHLRWAHARRSKGADFTIRGDTELYSVTAEAGPKAIGGNVSGFES